uniref:Large ribosomal subunit protein bL20c n=1 Tax=Afzelia bipindensis TaxID=162643 RepID=A0A8F3JCX0_9FABA|nr:ribosomal protein L20 [Afzelia bipindensis]
MTRIKRGYIARKHRTKTRLFTSSFRSKLTISQQKIKALVSAHRDRDRKKRDFRRLWISRINAVIRENKNEKYYSYSIFMYNYTRGSCFLIVKYLHK